MLEVHQTQSVEEAGKELRDFIVEPSNWVVLDRLKDDPGKRPGENPAYQRRVGKLQICASIDVSRDLDVFLRIAFRAPGLQPNRAADYLETFLKGWMPMVPNSEWQVRVDERKWIHFIRRYSSAALAA